jgi:shikimate kinase
VTRDLGTAIRGVLARSEPVLVFLAGPNGAGKSTFFRDYLQELNLPFINADELARRLRESSLAPKPEDVEKIAFEMTERLRLSLFDQASVLLHGNGVLRSSGCQAGLSQAGA